MLQITPSPWSLEGLPNIIGQVFTEKNVGKVLRKSKLFCFGILSHPLFSYTVHHSFSQTASNIKQHILKIIKYFGASVHLNRGITNVIRLSEQIRIKQLIGHKYEHILMIFFLI